MSSWGNAWWHHNICSLIADFFPSHNWGKILVKFHSKYKIFHSQKCFWKCHLYHVGHFIRWQSLTDSTRSPPPPPPPPPPPQLTRFMGPTWGRPGACRPQMEPMLASWSLLSGPLSLSVLTSHYKEPYGIIAVTLKRMVIILTKFSTLVTLNVFILTGLFFIGILSKSSNILIGLTDILMFAVYTNISVRKYDLTHCSGNDFLPLPVPVLTYYPRCSIAFTWAKITRMVNEFNPWHILGDCTFEINSTTHRD